MHDLREGVVALSFPNPYTREVYVDDRLSPNSLFLVGKSMFLCVPMFLLDGTLSNVFGSPQNVFGHLQILLDPAKNLGTLKIKNVTPINVKSWQVYPMFFRYTLWPYGSLWFKVHFNPSSPNIHIQILQNGLHTFP